MSDDDDAVDEFKTHTPLIIDTGSAKLKAGFTGDDAPCVVFPTVVGRRPHHSDDVYVGDCAAVATGYRVLTNPMERGVVKNWDDMEKVWHHTFHNELSVFPEDHKLLLIDSTMNTNEREKMAEVMFETFKIPGLHIASGAVMSLFGVGLTTGIVLESGHGATHAVPIHDGNVVTRAIEHVAFGGQDIAQYLNTFLSDRGHCFNTYGELDTVRDIKEKLCYVSSHFEEDFQNSKLEKKYELPSGQEITIEDEQFQATEALFKPSLLGMTGTPGIHEVIDSSIMKCFPEPFSKDLLPHIVLSGGNTMFSGIKERLESEISKLASPAKIAEAPNVIAAPERKLLSWIGGSIFTSLSSMNEKWITKEKYEEGGSSMIHKICLY